VLRERCADERRVRRAAGAARLGAARWDAPGTNRAQPPHASVTRGLRSSASSMRSMRRPTVLAARAPEAAPTA